MTDEPRLYQLRTASKDVGVALVVLAALALGLLLYLRADSRVTQFRPADDPFRIDYPLGWVETPSLKDNLLRVENPQTASAFKTTLTVERRLLDPQSPPTLQALLDRRVAERASLPSYHFFSNSETTVGGEKAMRLEYAYVVQPIDEPRRPSLPVVVQAREYIVVTKDRTYYITLAAPEQEFERAAARFERMIRSAQVA